MLRNRLQAYSSVDKATMSGRDIEAEVLTLAAAKLKQCQDGWNDADRSKKLQDALKYNQMIWSVFQGDLLDPTNPLPTHLKQQLLSLSAFVDKRIFDVMAYPEPQKISILISINMNIAAGLKESAQKTIGAKIHNHGQVNLSASL